jgi:hypothetical protein
MALDESHHRLFIGCRSPARILVLDTSSGKTITEFECAGDTDDVFYDAKNKRVYVSGGDPPKGFTTALTGRGKPGVWVVVKDETAPGKSNVLEKSPAGMDRLR